MSGKTLVAYFSASGVTEAVARRLADAIGADVFEIAPREAYTAADLDWTDSSSRSTRECKDPACRPALKSMPEGVEAYETVLIGFPIWWYTAPNIIKTFLEAWDFSSARIALFATSGGSGMGKTMSDLEPSAPQARWLDARRFSSDASARDLGGMGGYAGIGHTSAGTSYKKDASGRLVTRSVLYCLIGADSRALRAGDLTRSRQRRSRTAA